MVVTRNPFRLEGIGCEMKFSLPSAGGTYVLVLYLRKSAPARVGRLGIVAFKRGWYCYVGSAFGPGGLAARLKRHLVEEKKRHWHIDHLRALAMPKEIWISRADEPLEHAWAAVLMKSFPAVRPVYNFGCSDCSCPSHLFYCRRYPAVAQNQLKLERTIVLPRGAEGIFL